MIQHEKNYRKHVIDSRLQYFKPHSTKVQKSFADEISYSLSQNSKFISPKFFYNKKGSELFDKICDLPEYYLTRSEIGILKKLQNDLVNYLDTSFRLVELGSGSSVKTRLILDVFAQIQEKVEYFPVDISDVLTESVEILRQEYSNLYITGIIDTYESGLEFIENYDDKKDLIMFLGSSFGNFTPTEGQEFLKRINDTMKDDDLILLGLDLVKDKTILENAYDDSQKITSAFNLNVLSRINDELGADFDLQNFEHYATYNEEHQCIEMYLKSLVNQCVMVTKSKLSLRIQKDELIHTEFSHKYTLGQIQDLMKATGFNIKDTWTDENEYYVVTLASRGE